MSPHRAGSLFAATALVGPAGLAGLIGLAAIAAPASAQVAYPAAELHGLGAAAVAVTVQTELNAYTGTNQVLGNASDGSTTALNTVVSNGFDSSKTGVQSTVTGKYVQANSKIGRATWASFGLASFNNTTTGTFFPSAIGALWTDAHFALTETAISSTELSTFNTNSATKGGGAAIQFPLYVLPVGLAFNPVYGHVVSTNTDLTFNIGQTINVNGQVLPELLLTKRLYCGIANGYITNWNDSRIQALNTKGSGKTAVTNLSLQDPNDSTTRWSKDGVPIRLVGRLDSAGATDVFTRHLSTVCGGGILGQGNANNFLQNASYLPYNATSNIDLTTERTDTALKPTGAATSFAGTTNLISGVIFDAPAKVIRSARVKVGGVLQPGSYVELPGKYIVADGNANVAAAVNLAPDVASKSNSDVLLNGKLGYVSGDQIRPANGLAAGTNAIGATLEVGQSYATGKPVWAYPSSLNASAAFGTVILPPESDKNGKFVAGGQYSRAKPTDWYDSLYSGQSTLANPPVGYPITGTAQVLVATCYANPAVRNALVGFLQTLLGNVTNGVNAGKAFTFKSDAFVSLKTGTLGIPAQLNIAPLPAPWRQAVIETFLSDTTKKNPGLALETNSLGTVAPLYIQTGLPVGKVPSYTDPVTGKTVKAVTLKAGTAETVTQLNVETPGNPSCTAGQGVQ